MIDCTHYLLLVFDLSKLKLKTSALSASKEELYLTQLIHRNTKVSNLNTVLLELQRTLNPYIHPLFRGCLDFKDFTLKNFLWAAVFKLGPFL